MQEYLKIINTFQYNDKPTLNKTRMQAIFQKRIEKLQQLADTYNFTKSPLTLSFFGDLKSGIGFSVNCANPEIRQTASKSLKMFLNYYCD